MKSATSEQSKIESSEKKETPWRVAFTCGKKQPTYTEIRKDLLKACWGNEKMADVLYHFLFAGSWKAHHTQVDASVRVLVLQESHADILTKVKASEPTLITYLNLFAQVGYVCKASYKKALTINFEKIEQAFINAPDKPIQGKDLSLNLSLKNEQSKEVERLSSEVEKLTAQVQDLSLTLVSFKSWYAQVEHEFKLNLSLETKTFKLKNSDEDAPQAAADTDFFSKSNYLDIREEDKENKNGYAAMQNMPAIHLVEIDLLSEDFPEAQANFAYSHDLTPTNEEKSIEKSVTAASDGYMQESITVDEPVKPNKPSSRQRKPKVVQDKLPDPPNPGIELTSEEQRVFDLYCKLWFIAVPPKMTPGRKEHCASLAPHVHSKEDMVSLEESTRKYLNSRKIKVKVIELGNLVNNLNTWIAEQPQPDNVIDFQEKSSERLTWKERYENDPNNGGYNDQASFDAWMKTAEEMENAAI